jgi:hypothetical protein
VSVRCSAVLLVWLTACSPEVVIGYGPTLVSDAGPDASVEAGMDAAPDAAEDTGVVDTGTDAAPDVDVPEPLPEITWPSGGHPGNEVQTYFDFGTWRGRPLAVAHVFPDRAAWDGIVTPAWPVDMFGPFDGTLIMSLPPYPEGMGNDVDCAAGTYDGEWAKLGPFLVGRGRADTILRLSWGPNDNDHYWRVPSDASGAVAQADVDAFIGCFRRIVDVVRASDPEIRIDWSFNRIGAPAIADFDPYLTYPGDDYVDFVGIEVFDMYPPATTDEEWDAICNAPTGLCTLAEFARAHDKQLGIAEWAVIGCGTDGQPDPVNVGGDSPFFVLKVVETFAAYADVMAYEAYFEDNAEVCSNINGGTDNVSAAAKYRELYGLRE